MGNRGDESRFAPAAPLLLVALITGLIISNTLQAATQTMK